MALKEVTINLDLPYRMREGELEGIARSIGFNGVDPQRRDISEFLIKTAVNTKHQQAMPKTDSRLWNGILTLMEEQRTATLTLNGDQFRWLDDLFSKHDFAAALTKWRFVLLDEFERAKKAAEESAASAEAAKE